MRCLAHIVSVEKITPLRTIKSTEIDGRLFKAISNYHGISNFDDYWRNILGLLYDVHSYKQNLNIVYHIGRVTPVGPRTLSKLLWAATDCWCEIVNEDKISAQVNIASPGPVDFQIVDAIPQLIDAAKVFAGLTIGAISVVKPEAIPTFLKKPFLTPSRSQSRIHCGKTRKITVRKRGTETPSGD